MAETTVISPVLKSFLAGSLSGSCSTLLFQPLDLVKTRLQTKAAAPRGRGGMAAVVAQVVAADRVRGLWRGITPSMLRCAPGVGLYFSSLHSLKGALPDDLRGPLVDVALGVTARTVSGVAMIPMTVIKTRYESGVYGYRSVRGAVAAIYRSEGSRGLTCGLTATLLRDAPFSGLYLMFYTQVKQAAPEEVRLSSASPLVHFASGLLAGALASAATQPADVIKTKMQLYPHKFTNIYQVAVYVVRKYGAAGFLKGLYPRLLRRTLMAAMSWTVYERMMQQFNLK